MLKLCSDDPLLTLLRASFPDTHVLRRPSQRLQPLTVLSVHKKLLRAPEVIVLGPLGGMLSRDREMPQKSSAPSPQISGTRSRNLSHDVGFSLLAGFLEGFGVNPQLFAEHFEGVDSLAFEFQSVEEHTVDLGTRMLSGARLDPRSPAVRPALDGKARLAIIDRVLTSSGFTVELSSRAGAKFELSLPTQEALAKVSVKLEASGEEVQRLQFSGETPLAFAFSAVIAEIGADATITGFVPPEHRLDFAPDDNNLHAELWPQDEAHSLTEPE